MFLQPLIGDWRDRVKAVKREDKRAAKQAAAAMAFEAEDHPAAG